MSACCHHRSAQCHIYWWVQSGTSKWVYFVSW